MPLPIGEQVKETVLQLIGTTALCVGGERSHYHVLVWSRCDGLAKRALAYFSRVLGLFFTAIERAHVSSG
jgi:hypothetical protein